VNGSSTKLDTVSQFTSAENNYWVQLVCGAEHNSTLFY